MNVPKNPMQCPVCRSPLQSPVTGYDATDIKRVQCLNCGPFRVSFQALVSLDRESYDPPQRAALAHEVSRMQRDGLLTLELLTHWEKHAQLPGAMEQLDLLVQLLAIVPPGHGVNLKDINLRARLGCEDITGILWLRDQATGMGLIQAGAVQGHTLTIAGWQRHAELMRAAVRSDHAFMAMRFSDEMWRVFNDWMQPAVALTGFKLRAASGDHQTAGSIDDRMRVEIRTSRFTVCDLTDGNQGAYWEAGFAEGVGRPVFYTCRADVLASTEAGKRVHFDTAHQLIVPWDPADMAKGMQILKNAIRATLPAEARMSDQAAAP
jgi:hypothetical protein